VKVKILLCLSKFSQPAGRGDEPLNVMLNNSLSLGISGLRCLGRVRAFASFLKEKIKEGETYVITTLGPFPCLLYFLGKLGE